MNNKILLSLLASATLATSMLAKYTTLPSECHYIYTKKSDYFNKKDVKCLAKYVAVQTNANTPKKYGVVTLNEVIPSSTTLISKYTVTNVKKFNEGVKSGSIEKAMNNVCKMSGLRLAFQQGLKYDNRFYNSKGAKIISFIVDKDTCNIK